MEQRQMRSLGVTLSVLPFLLLAVRATDESPTVSCVTIDIPTLSGESGKHARTCFLAGAKNATYPLFVFSHGNEAFGKGGLTAVYEPYLREIAAMGFVATAYASCPVDSGCFNGQAQFLDAIATVRHFEQHPAAAPIDFTMPYSGAGHSTGARAMLMLAGARDRPDYLANTSFVNLTADDRAVMAKFACVVADHPDPMYDPAQNPDVARFGIDRTPTMILTGSWDVRPVGEPELSGWNDFVRFTERLQRGRVFVNMRGESHLQPLLSRSEVPYVGWFAQYHSLGNATAGELIYGDSLPGSLLARFDADDGFIAGPGKTNSGDGVVGLLACREGHPGVPSSAAHYCTVDAAALL